MRGLIVVTLALAALGCGAKQNKDPVGITVGRSDAAPVRFAYDSLDARPVSSESMRGRFAVMAFVTTWDLVSQAQAEFLSVMAKTDGDAVAYALVVLDDAKNRELVEAYAKTLGIECPVAMGDVDTVAGHGAFGELTVPTSLVLDPDGKVVWRKAGLAQSDELRRVLSTAQSARR